MSRGIVREIVRKDNGECPGGEENIRAMNLHAGLFINTCS